MTTDWRVDEALTRWGQQCGSSLKCDLALALGVVGELQRLAGEDILPCVRLVRGQDS